MPLLGDDPSFILGHDSRIHYREKEMLQRWNMVQYFTYSPMLDRSR